MLPLRLLLHHLSVQSVQLCPIYAAISMQYNPQNIQAFAALSLSSMALLAFKIISSFFFSKDACLCDLSVDHAGGFRWFDVEAP